MGFKLFKSTVEAARKEKKENEQLAGIGLAELKKMTGNCNWLI